MFLSKYTLFNKNDTNMASFQNIKEKLNSYVGYVKCIGIIDFGRTGICRMSDYGKPIKGFKKVRGHKEVTNSDSDNNSFYDNESGVRYFSEDDVLEHTNPALISDEIAEVTVPADDNTIVVRPYKMKQKYEGGTSVYYRVGPSTKLRTNRYKVDKMTGKCDSYFSLYSIRSRGPLFQYKENNSYDGDVDQNLDEECSTGFYFFTDEQSAEDFTY